MLTPALLARVLRQASSRRLDACTPPLRAAMAEFGIDTNRRRAAAFIAQLAHESGEFRWMEERWGPTAAQRRYEPPGDLARRLGNTEPGDGWRYRGRGPIQLTGRANYRRCGQALGLDLEARPEQVADPAVGFRVAGWFWSHRQLNARADAGDFVGITRGINGGTNGLAERERYHALALAALAGVYPEHADDAPAGAHPPASVHAPAAGAGAGAGAGALAVAAAGADAAPGLATGAAAAPARRRRRTAPRRVYGARADTLDFRDLMYVPSLVEVPTQVPLGDYLEWQVPILDQGSEGACTGYALATVANYLLLRRRTWPDPVPVSPRMLYTLARRYDEWPGERYEGSSARGAMKGWHKHGVCSEAAYPSQPDDDGLTDERTSDARRRPLGAYFRVNHRDLVAMHSALAEVGVLYATAVVHQGWSAVGPDGLIAASDERLGGHAFAIVAYDERGFWIQNSWGPDWGHGGFAQIGYDDWLRNGTDVWVARLGAPVRLETAAGTADAHADGAGRSAAYSQSDLRPHIVAVGNDGLLRAGGEFGSSAAEVERLVRQDIPRVTAPWGTRRVLLYAHGGLVGETAAVQRVADYRRAMLPAQIYPLAFVWNSDAWTTVTNLLQDAVRRRRPEGVLDAAKDFMLDRLDDALEPLARALGGKALWDEMKENALRASQRADGAARRVADLLQGLAADGRGLELHLAAHSAGAILLGPLVGLLAERGLAIESCTLWAPACRHAQFAGDYQPAIAAGQIRRFALYLLDDTSERDDHCAHLYNKSLLYLVSHALEERPRVPQWRDEVVRPSRNGGEPLLGLERDLTTALRALLATPGHRLVVAPDPRDTGALSRARHHGDFDDDEATVASTIDFIRGGGPSRVATVRQATPAPAEPAPGPLCFPHSGSALRDRRQEIDQRTRR